MYENLFVVSPSNQFQRQRDLHSSVLGYRIDTYAVFNYVAMFIKQLASITDYSFMVIPSGDCEGDFSTNEKNKLFEAECLQTLPMIR